MPFAVMSLICLKKMVVILEQPRRTCTSDPEWKTADSAKSVNVDYKAVRFASCNQALMITSFMPFAMVKWKALASKSISRCNHR